MKLALRQTKRSSGLDAVVAGYLGLDLAPGFPPGRGRGADWFRPGKLIETEGVTVSLGGVVANTGLALKRFGCKVALIGLVGRDAFGDIVIARLRDAGVRRGIRRHPRANTAYGVVISPPGVDRMFLEDPGCNRVFGPTDIDYRLVARSRLFHFGYPPLMDRFWRDGGAGCVAMLRRVRRLGVATSLDLALPDAEAPAGQADWRAILERVLPHVDIFVPSLEELVFMLEPTAYRRLLARAGGGDPLGLIPRTLAERLADWVMGHGVKILLLKAGGRGALLQMRNTASLNRRTRLRLPEPLWHDEKRWLAPCAVQAHRVRNANGAGDCAVAGLLAALLGGAGAVEAGHYAMIAGRDNLYGADAHAGLTDWATMTAAAARQVRGR